MHHKPILIIPGQLDSIFFEIFFKSLRKKKIISPLILICSEKIFKLNAKKYKFKGKLKLISPKINKFEINNKHINIINVNLEKSKNNKFKIELTKKYLTKCFMIGFEILKNNLTYKLLNGPINKKKFLDKKFLGITEFISSKFKIKEYGMLIYNKKLSVSPLTTHLPIKIVTQKISKKLIQKRLKLIDDFYQKKFKFKPRIAVTGLNPHCESISNFNEDEKIITPAIKLAKKNKILVSGPYPADTIFLKQNREKFNVILGMYHDQVLTSLKTLYEYDAINITMGLPFKRVSPDHGPNENMIGKNSSNPISLIRSLEFLDKN